MTSAPDSDGQVAALERTALAWERTGFGVSTVGALLVHGGDSRQARVLLVFGVVVMAVGVLLILVGTPLRHRALHRRLLRGWSPVQRGVLFALAAFVLSVSLVALVLGV